MRQQNSDNSSFQFQQHRKRHIRDDLLAVVGAFGKSRALLMNRGPWDEASRGSMPYEPAEKLQQMMRSVSAAAAKYLGPAEREEVRVAIHRLYATLCLDATESLIEAESTDLVSMYQETVKESAEATCAAVAAVTATNESSVDRAVREATDEINVLVRFRNRLFKAGRSLRLGRPSVSLAR
jgi:hypothetical protein